MISFVPGEATEEQAFDIVGRFAKEYLGDKYEAVYAVHNDKEHMHGHIVFNSVSFETGAKYDYLKGEWKRRMQPLTNKLCAEHGLNIMPAEYAKRQKFLCQENSVHKRACKTKEDVRNYQIWHLGVQEELDALKAEKKELNKRLKLVEACKTEYKSFSRFAYTDIEDEIGHSVEVPEYPYAGKKQAERYDEYEFVAEIEDNTGVSEMPMDIDTDKRNDGSFDVDKISSIAVEDDIIVAEDDVANVEVITPEIVGADKTYLADQITYEEYKRMTPLEKAQSCGFIRLRSYDAVEGVVKFKLMELGHTATVDELMEETEFLYKGMRELVVRTKVDEVLEEVEKSGLSFICWASREKAELLQFQLDDNSYNMQLYNAVCKACGIDTSDMDEAFEDYQAIYDKTVEMQGDKEVGRKEGW